MTRWKNSPQKRTRGSIDCQGPNQYGHNYKIPELEFRIMIVKILAGLEKSIEDTRESLSGEIKELKSNQVKITRAINEMQ